jgi:hypothetical protein
LNATLTRQLLEEGVDVPAELLNFLARSIEVERPVCSSAGLLERGAGPVCAAAHIGFELAERTGDAGI